MEFLLAINRSKRMYLNRDQSRFLETSKDMRRQKTLRAFNKMKEIKICRPNLSHDNIGYRLGVRENKAKLG